MLDRFRQLARSLTGILTLFWVLNGVALASFDCSSNDLPPVAETNSSPCHQPVDIQHNCDDVCVCAQVDKAANSQLDSKSQSFTPALISYVVTLIEPPASPIVDQISSYRTPLATAPPYLRHCRFLI